MLKYGVHLVISNHDGTSRTFDFECEDFYRKIDVTPYGSDTITFVYGPVRKCTILFDEILVCDILNHETCKTQHYAKEEKKMSHAIPSGYSFTNEWLGKDYYNYARAYNMAVKKVIFNGPATIVIWKDNTKTIVKKQGGEDICGKEDRENGLAWAIAKKALGDNFKSTFKEFVPDEEGVTYETIRDILTKMAGWASQCNNMRWSIRKEKEDKHE